MEEKKRTIKIFKTFEEQHDYQLQRLRETSVNDRFAALYEMQKFTESFHKKNLPEGGADKRVIIIHYGYLK